MQGLQENAGARDHPSRYFSTNGRMANHSLGHCVLHLTPCRSITETTRFDVCENPASVFIIKAVPIQTPTERSLDY